MKQTNSATWYFGKVLLLKKIGHYQRFLQYRESMAKARPDMGACRILYNYLCNHGISGYKPHFYKRGSKNEKH